MHVEEHNHCFMHYFGVKTLSETLFSPPFMKSERVTGLGRGVRRPRHFRVLEPLAAERGDGARDSPDDLQLLRVQGHEHDAAARDRHVEGELPGVHARGGPRRRAPAGSGSICLKEKKI